MRKLLLFLFVCFSLCGLAQNKYQYKDVLDFKKGMLDTAREMTKSVPIQVNEYQTLIAIGVTENLVTFKYEIGGWDGNVMMSKDEIEGTKSLTALNMLRSQQYLEMFLECLRRTKFAYQLMFFSEDRKYIGGFRLAYSDFITQLESY